MSEGDVSLIRDEDVLRRMWQQTEDFSRKKEIRAHMYRLREERLRDLYSPEPTARSDGKGCEFTSTQGHGQSFADQTFQSMKSKEVRDAGSPPKEFTYHGQDLKELSNAGWNVESEDRTTNDGHTHVKSIHANIEGKYDVDGGRGQFAAVDHQKQAVTEYHDDNSSLKRNESSSNTAAREHVVQQTDDGTRISSTTSSSTSTSKFQQVSSKHEVPYTNDDYDQYNYDTNTNRNEKLAKIIKTNNDYDQNVTKNAYSGGELISRKIDYPDNNTKVIVETRCLPDGTRVTSTRREFRVPSQSTRSEQHYQSKTENKSFSTSQKSETRESSKTTSHTIDNRINDIVDSQKNVDDHDFRQNQVTHYTTIDDDDTCSQTSKTYRNVTNTNDNDRRETITTRDDRKVQNQNIENVQNIKNVSHKIRTDKYFDKTDDFNQQDALTTQKDYYIPQQVVRDAYVSDADELTYNVTKNRKDETVHNIKRDRKEEIIEKKTTTNYQTTYQTDQTQRKISQDWSPSHQAWACTLRADTPSTTRPSTRASSPGSRTFKSSNSSLRSSVSPDKTYKKPSSRGGSPNKVDRYSPTRTVSDRFSTTHSTHTVTETRTNKHAGPDGKPPHGRSPTRPGYSPDRKPQEYRQRPSASPEKRPQDFRPSISPERKPGYKMPNEDNYRTTSPTRPISKHDIPAARQSPDRKGASSEKKPDTTYTRLKSPQRSSTSPEKKPVDGYSTRPSQSPERKPISQDNHTKPLSDKPSSYYRPSDSLKRPSVSPDRKSHHQNPANPTPGDDYPRTISPTRPQSLDKNEKRLSPDKKIGSDKPSDNYPDARSNTTSPTITDSTQKRPSMSPDRKPRHEKPSANYPDSKYVMPSSPNKSIPSDTISDQQSIRPTDDKEARPSTSPDKSPGYMKPTASSKLQTDVTKSSPRSSPDKIPKHIPSQSPDRKHSATHTTLKEDHYRFVNEETKMYTLKDNEDVVNDKHPHERPEKVSSPIRETSPTKDVPDFSHSESPSSHPKSEKDFKAPSPQKDTLMLSINKDVKSEIDVINKYNNQVKNVTVKSHPTKSASSPKSSPGRDSSPQKYGTYNKKKTIEESSTITVKDTLEKHDSITRREKVAAEKVPDFPTSLDKKPPKEDVSRVRSPIKDNKYKNTTDFTTAEKTCEEISKNNTKDHPRQLITPSSSPTRKPKVTDTEPSTGQSSPTTSVSGFVYFGSPRPDNNLITDLDEQQLYTNTNKTEETKIINKRPQNLDIDRPSSPSKIPCRSPSPEKRSPLKESLPRKSSLKKPTRDSILSPTEKPPSSFCISPTMETADSPSHKIVKKDQPDTPEPAPKSKPPFERRETYEERCKKILGMEEDTLSMTVNTESNISSPNESPCRSPKDTSPLRKYYNRDVNDKKKNVIEFISHEKEDTTKSAQSDTKRSRETSPTKLQDIISKPKTIIKSEITTEENPNQEITKIPEQKHLINSSKRNPDESNYPYESIKPDILDDGKPHKAQESCPTPEYVESITTTHRLDANSSFEDSRKTKSSVVKEKDAKLKPCQSPTSKSSMPIDQQPESLTNKSTSADSKRRLESPERKSYQQPSPTRKSPEKKSTVSYHNQLSSNRSNISPGKIQKHHQTTISTSKYHNESTEDIQETIIKDTEDEISFSSHPDDDNKLKRPSASPDRKMTYQKPLRRKETGNKLPRESSPITTSPEREKGRTEIIKPTASDLYSGISDVQKEVSSVTYNKHYTSQSKMSPTRESKELIGSHSDYPKAGSPTDKRYSLSPERKPNIQNMSGNKHPRELSANDNSPDRKTGFIRTTETDSTFDTMTSNTKRKVTSETVEKHDKSRSSVSPTRISKKPGDERAHYPRTASPTQDDISKKHRSPDYKHPSYPCESSPNAQSPERKPGFMKSTKSSNTKYGTETEEIQKTVKIIKKHDVSRSSISPSRTPIEPTDVYPDSPRKGSPAKDDSSKRYSLSPERNSAYEQPSSTRKEPRDKHPHESVSNTTSPEKEPGYMRTTKSTMSKFDSEINEINEDLTIETTKRHSTLRSEDTPLRKPTKIPHDITEHNDSKSKHSESPARKSPKFDEHATSAPTKPNNDIKDRRSTSPEKKLPSNKKPSEELPKASFTDRTPGYMKTTTSVTSKYEKHDETEEKHHTETVYSKATPKSATSNTKNVFPKSTQPSDKFPGRPSLSPERLVKTPVKPLDNTESTGKPTGPTIFHQETITSETGEPEYPTHQTFDILKSKPKEIRRSPSPTKVMKIKEVSTDFIMSEREQEILNRVEKSLRKLSPDRNERSPDREKTPSRSTKKTITDVSLEINEQHPIIKDTRPSQSNDIRPKEHKTSSKPSSRNVSPTKKPTNISSPIKTDKTVDFPSTARSTSPRKPISPTERPQSPHMTRTSGPVKPSHLTRKPTPASLSPIKGDKIVTNDTKNTSGLKQNNVTKNLTKITTVKIPQTFTKQVMEPETKRAPTSKNIKDTIGSKKDTTKVMRTVSDITMKSKNTSPQRMKSKPEIHVNDISTKKTTITVTKTIKKEPHSKLPQKPKSATALNTSTDEDDIIIDVQQSKSSRENSPDRICPTPINLLEDVGTPRFPDEVSEPDDEFHRRTYQTIHETESIVDDIVEICEDDELFVKRTDVNRVTGTNENGFNNKTPKYVDNNETTSKPKPTKKTVTTDFTHENLRADECLLSVSEKVNIFGKGQRDTKEKSPLRRIVDEYDNNTIYQDDCTKLSVNDKAHLFVETAENTKVTKLKPLQKIERPDLSTVDESLKSDDCLLSVSDKVNKFVKTAEQFLSDSYKSEEKEKKIKEQHDEIMRKIVENVDDEVCKTEKKTTNHDNEISTKTQPKNIPDTSAPKKSPLPKSSIRSQPREKEPLYTNLKSEDKPAPAKITTLRSSEAVKKAKALFENIATTQKKETTSTPSKTTKLTDIGVMKKSPKTDSTIVLHPSLEDNSTNIDFEYEIDTPEHNYPTKDTLPKSHSTYKTEKNPRSSPPRLGTQSSETPKSKSPTRHMVETTTTTKIISTEHPVGRSESPRYPRSDSERPRTPQDKTPGYLRPTKTSQIKEDRKDVEEIEVSSRRGSGKFGVELRKTSVERSTTSSERRRSVDHPCIEDIFDLDLLEQMLEKVVGYEQRRRIRSQIRVAKKMESEQINTNTYTKISKQTTTKPRSPERHLQRSPERRQKSPAQKTLSPERKPTKNIEDVSDEHITVTGFIGHTNESSKIVDETVQRRPKSLEKPASKMTSKTSVRQTSPEKKSRPQSPAKSVGSKVKSSRINEYTSAYMKKVGLNESDKIKYLEKKLRKEEDNSNNKQIHEHNITEKHVSTTSKSRTERTSSKEIIEIEHINGKRSPSPQKRQSLERQLSPERVHKRSPSPELKNQKSDSIKKETIIKTVHDIEKKIPQKPVQEEKPSWVTNRNLKKITSETRTFSSKKLENEKPKYRAPSPSKMISKPVDVITSSYGPGPLDAEGKPLFGIRALRNGSSNLQVKGTVIRQEFHSRNGGEPEGTVSVTAYSTQPEDLERLLESQGEPPSKIHGLSAITTTKKFGGDSGTTLKEIQTKEERASLDQFTHSDRRVDSRLETIDRTFDTRQEKMGDRKLIKQEKVERTEERRPVCERKERIERSDDKKTVRQSSVKSLTEKYIKSASDTSKTERSAYPKAGLILRTTSMKDSVSSDSSVHAGLTRTDSEHSLASVEDDMVTRTERVVGADGVTTTTTMTTRTHHEHTTDQSFLDSSTKVSGVQDILTRMKNADIVIQEGDTTEDTEARALLNKFLGASVLMAGMQNYVTEKPSGKVIVKQETVRSDGGKVTTSRTVEEIDLDQCWDERVLKKLLDECTDYEQRRRLRARIRTLMAEQEACASAVTDALAAAGEATDGGDGVEPREEEEVITVTSSVRRNSSESKTISSSTTTKTSKVIESMSRPAPKPVSPFAKFRQLEKQNSTNSPNSPISGFE